MASFKKLSELNLWQKFIPKWMKLKKKKVVLLQIYYYILKINQRNISPTNVLIIGNYHMALKHVKGETPNIRRTRWSWKHLRA